MTHHRLITTAAAGLLAVGLSVAASPAHADGGLDFRWSASELATADNVAGLHQRIAEEANRYCARHLRGTRGISRQQRCAHEVASDIVRQIDDPALTYYAATGRTEGTPLAENTSVASGCAKCDPA